MIKRKLKKLFLLTLMLLFICFLVINIFTNGIIAENDLNDNKEENYYEFNNFLNDSTDHLIWFTQVNKPHSTIRLFDF